MRLEDPRTYECWPSYETIGRAIGKSKSSVKRYVAGLVEKGLITVEPTSVIMQNGLYDDAFVGAISEFRATESVIALLMLLTFPFFCVMPRI